MIQNQQPVCVALVALFLSWNVMVAQAPAPAPAPRPKLQVDQARLAFTVPGLAGANHTLAYAPDAGLVVVSGQTPQMQYLPPMALLGLQPAPAAAPTVTASDTPIHAVAAHGLRLFLTGPKQLRMLEIQPFGAPPPATVPVEDSPRLLTVAPDGKWAATAGTTGAVTLIDLNQGKVVRTWPAHDDWIAALGFHPGGALLATAGYDQRVRVWNVADGAKAAELTLPAPPAGSPPMVPTALAYSANGQLLGVAVPTGVVHLIKTADGAVAYSLAGHAGPVTKVAWHPHEPWLATAGKDRTVRLWNATNGQAMKVLEGYGSWVTDAAWVADGALLATTGADQILRVWDLRAK
jgi:WD40 repeat protein